MTRPLLAVVAVVAGMVAVRRGSGDTAGPAWFVAFLAALLAVFGPAAGAF